MHTERLKLMAQESNYFISETDELVPVLVMLIQGAPPGSTLNIQAGGDIFITVTKEENVGFTVSTSHPGVQQLLERLGQAIRQMRT